VIQQVKSILAIIANRTNICWN